jgi:drug/metabolite transporter superfamily protein YnfA
VLWGLAGLMILQVVKFKRAILGLSTLFFIGLIVTAFASAWYHLQPDNDGLAIDRLGMTVAFAGLLGLAAADRASLRAGVILSGLTLALGSLSVWAWSMSGNVLPWLVLQFGGMALILWLATRQPIPNAKGALAVRWGVVILIYAAAKVLELVDHAVYDLTSQLISGHSLKHIVASFAAWPVVSALRTQVIFNKDGAINANNFGATRI